MPEVLCYSGYYETGIAEVWEMIDRYFEFVKANGHFEAKRQQQARYWMYETINEKLRNHFYNDADVAALLEDREKRVLANQQSSFIAARDVLDFYFKKL